MREIKFRAWDKENNKFTKDLGIVIMLNGNILDGCDLEAKNIIIQQFTGLKDKNGKEIYEGDLLKYEETGSFGVMTWLGKTAQFGFSNGWANPVYGYTNVNEAVIIGNIYENPELINHPLT